MAARCYDLLLIARDQVCIEGVASTLRNEHGFRLKSHRHLQWQQGLRFETDPILASRTRRHRRPGSRRAAWCDAYRDLGSFRYRHLGYSGRDGHGNGEIVDEFLSGLAQGELVTILSLLQLSGMHLLLLAICWFRICRKIPGMLKGLEAADLAREREGWRSVGTHGLVLHQHIVGLIRGPLLD